MRTKKKKCEDSCKTCGVPWHDHLGIVGTCAKLELAKDGLQIVRTWAKFPHPHVTNEESLNEIREFCDKRLKELK